MSQTVSLVLTAQTREALRRIVDDRRRPLAHILRARIVLLSDERLPVLEVARQAGVGRPTVWRWQQRFAEEGLDGLLRDKTRPPGKPATPQDEVQAVLERTLTGEPPGEATHWTGRAMAALCGLSLTTVQRIWRSHHLQPHRVRTFKRSTDPHFAAKLDDVVGLYMAPPRHTIVLSVDEKVSDPGARPHAAGAAAQARPVRDLHARRCPQRHHHAVRGAEHAGGHRVRPLRAAPPPPGVHRLPRPDRGGGAGRQGDPRRHGVETSTLLDQGPRSSAHSDRSGDLVGHRRSRRSGAVNTPRPHGSPRPIFIHHL